MDDEETYDYSDDGGGSSDSGSPVRDTWYAEPAPSGGQDFDPGEAYYYETPSYDSEPEPSYSGPPTRDSYYTSPEQGYARSQAGAYAPSYDQGDRAAAGDEEPFYDTYTAPEDRGYQAEDEPRYATYAPQESETIAYGAEPLSAPGWQSQLPPAVRAMAAGELNTDPFEWSSQVGRGAADVVVPPEVADPTLRAVAGELLAPANMMGLGASSAAGQLDASVERLLGRPSPSLPLDPLDYLEAAPWPVGVPVRRSWEPEPEPPVRDQYYAEPPRLWRPTVAPEDYTADEYLIEPDYLLEGP
jgi:hypothetical protein